ncbi:MAG: hypothetical protein RJB66_864 [Pseudomonadota bacterium]|jgi:TonB family protein
MSYTFYYPKKSTPRFTKTVEIDLIEKEGKQKSNPSPIRFTEAPKELIDDSIDALKKKSNLLSEKLQRVKKEMAANLAGLTKNAQTKALADHSNKTSAQRNQPQIETNGNVNINSETKDSGEISNKIPLDLSPSTFGNHLNKKVDIGQFTALNTDRHLFYSFYSRIEEMIRPPWEERITHETQKLTNKQPFRPKGGWATRIDVLLDPDGKLMKVVLLKSSGIEGYDTAAIEAFQRAGFFPHPPKEIVNEEGTILLKYIFHVF